MTAQCDPGQWLLNLVPPPRKRITVGAVFHCSFPARVGGGCLWLSLTRVVVFSGVAPFWLLILAFGCGGFKWRGSVV